MLTRRNPHQPRRSDPAVLNVSFESDSSTGDEWNEIAGRVDGIPVFALAMSFEADRPRLGAD